MKKMMLLLGFVLTALIVNGCALSSGYAVAGGFPRTMPALLVSNQKAGGYIGQKLTSTKDVIVLGKVSSEVSAGNALLVVAFGDASIETAKKEALKKYPQADDVVNVEIDIKHEGLLCLYNTVTMYYRGLAIQYKK